MEHTWNTEELLLQPALMVDILFPLEPFKTANLGVAYPVLTCGGLMNASNDRHIFISAPINVKLTALDTFLILVIAHYPTFCIT